MTVLKDMNDFQSDHDQCVKSLVLKVNLLSWGAVDTICNWAISEIAPWGFTESQDTQLEVAERWIY